VRFLAFTFRGLLFIGRSSVEFRLRRPQLKRPMLLRNHGAQRP
jgi:hypothetical protein